MSAAPVRPASKAKPQSKRTGITRSVVFDRPVLAAAVIAAKADDRSLSKFINLKLRPILGLPVNSK